MSTTAIEFSNEIKKVDFLPNIFFSTMRCNYGVVKKTNFL